MGGVPARPGLSVGRPGRREARPDARVAEEQGTEYPRIRLRDARVERPVLRHHRPPAAAHTVRPAASPLVHPSRPAPLRAQRRICRAAGARRVPGRAGGRVLDAGRRKLLGCGWPRRDGCCVHVPTAARRGPRRRPRRRDAAPARHQHGLALPRRPRQVHRRGDRELRGRPRQAGGPGALTAPGREIRLARHALRHWVRGTRVHGPRRARPPSHSFGAAGRLVRRASGPGPRVCGPARIRHAQRRRLPRLGDPRGRPRLPALRHEGQGVERRAGIRHAALPARRGRGRGSSCADGSTTATAQCA